MDAGEELAERLLHLRQHQEDGRRSPHKPLLVLMALGKLAETGSSRLADLLAEFGPPRRSEPKPEYPFTRLRSDMVRKLSRNVSMDSVGPLRDQPISGMFAIRLEEHLRANQGEILTKARIIAEQQFPTSIASDVLVAVGLDPDSVFAAGRGNVQATDLRRRSAAWRHLILHA